MKKIVLDKNGIHEVQQNRDPYLLIDYASEVIPGKSAKGYKDLNEDEFKVIWGRIYHSYWDDITFSRVNESKDQLNLEPSY